MKTLVRHLIPNAGTLIVVGLLLLAQSAGALPAAAPAEPLALSTTVVSYQGMLTDPSGTPINDTVTMQFALYDAASDGNLVWGPETHSVQVSDGLFHVLLGSVVPLNPTALTGDMFLDIKVNDEELSPREPVASAVYAMEARHLVTSGTPDVTATSGGIEIHDAGGSTLRMDGNEIDSTSGLHLQREHTDKAVILFSALDMNAQQIIDVGKVGIGTSSPQHGQVMIRTNAVPLSFKEADQAGAGSLWRMPLDGTDLRFDASQNGSNFDEYISPLQLHADGSIGCGAITENNLQTEEERAAGRSERFEEGDVLCWSAQAERLEKCSTVSDPLVQAIADTKGRPIVIGAEAVKVIGPVRAGDYLVASSVPGYAMASPHPTFGVVIAQALEDFDGERGIIKAMIRKM